MKKLLIFSLVLVLIGVSILPTVAAPKSAEAWSGTVTVDPGELYFRVYEGVPTYLLGFIPLDEGQKLTLTHEGGFLESAGWTVTDDAEWLNQAPLFGVVGCLNRNQDVTVRVNTKGLKAGTYTATITFKFTTCATKTITVPVTADVIEPKVMGPLGIGMLNILDTSTENYGGFVVNLLTNPDDAMDMQAIETDGCFNLMLQRGEEIPGADFIPLNGGTFTINREAKQIVEGGVAEFSLLMGMMPPGMIPIPEDFDWGENRIVMFATDDGGIYIGILLSDLAKLMELLPMLGDMFTGSDESTSLPAPTGKQPKNGAPNSPASNEPSPELVVPLKPILNLLPILMPVMVDLLSNETMLNILAPLMGLLPPIMIVMPFDVMMDLFSGLM
ncbi:MAG: hypothetical protein WC333_05320 [Dehalococcoidia bacterium]